MRTTKPISTISFNTPDYLAQKLDELVKAKRLSFWAFIPHLPEDDEAGNRDHIHLYIEPAKMLQTDDLKEEFKEFDPAKPDKPRGCISFRSSKFSDWYLYALHDRAYLASKGQSRKYHYKHDDVRSSDPDDLQFKARTIDMLAVSPYADILEAQRHGFTWEQYFKRGTVPLPQIALFERAWYTLLAGQDDSTNRNGRDGHPMDIDRETGEVTEIPDDELPY